MTIFRIGPPAGRAGVVAWARAAVVEIKKRADEMQKVRKILCIMNDRRHSMLLTLKSVNSDLFLPEYGQNRGTKLPRLALLCF